MINVLLLVLLATLTVAGLLFIVVQNKKGAVVPGSGNKMLDSYTMWWTEKDPSDKRWFLYTILAVVAIMVGYFLPEDYGSRRYVIVGGMVLLVLHLVIWPFFSETTSLLTKTLVSLFLIYCAFGFVFPDYTDRTVNNAKAWRKDINDNAGKELSQQAVVTGGPVKTVDLKCEQSEAVHPIPSSKEVRFMCDTPGAEMMIDYASAQNALVSPGQWFSCPLPGETVHVAEKLVGERFYFRSCAGGKAFIENGMG